MTISLQQIWTRTKHSAFRMLPWACLSWQMNMPGTYSAQRTCWALSDPAKLALWRQCCTILKSFQVHFDPMKAVTQMALKLQLSLQNWARWNNHSPSMEWEGGKKNAVLLIADTTGARREHRPTRANGNYKEKDDHSYFCRRKSHSFQYQPCRLSQAFSFSSRTTCRRLLWRRNAVFWESRKIIWLFWAAQ